MSKYDGFMSKPITGPTYTDLARQVDTLKADIAAKDKAMRDYFEWHGAEHDDGCPQDDTCECPRVVQLNRAFGAEHPGTAILEEMEALRKEIARLNEYVGARS